MLRVKSIDKLGKMTEEGLNKYAEEVYAYYDKIIGWANRLEDNRVHREERLAIKKLVDQKKKKAKIKKGGRNG